MIEAASSGYNEEDILQRLREVIGLRTMDGTPLIELTKYNNIFMWWFVDQDFFIRVGSNNRIGNDRLLIRRLKESSILYFLYGLVVSPICKLNIKLYRTTKFHKKKNRILVVAQNHQWRTILDPNEGISKKGDAFFDSIISELRKNDETEIVTIYPLNYSISNLGVIIDKKINQNNIIHKPFETYWSLNAWRKGRIAKSYFSKLWCNFEGVDNLRKMSELCGITFELLNDRISYYFNIVFGIMVEYIEMAKRMIDEEKPDLILLLNEYGRFERSLLIAAKLKGIPTLAVQHGIITPTHYGYIFDKVYKDSLFLPDITCVYGQYHYDLLTKKSIYNPENVVITGQPRYDILNNANKIYNKTEFLKVYNINNKILLWTTQCHGLSDDENLAYIDAIFAAIKNIKNITLVIKQHPGEGAKYTKMFENYINKYDVDAVITPKGSDTYEQIYACDLMITKDSTTAMEAVALEKPVIVLNLSGEPDVVNYVEEGVALGVYRREDLKSAVENLIENDSELAENRTKYIKKYLYAIDGRATERVVKEINKVLLKNKH